MAQNSESKVKVTLIKSLIGRKPRHLLCVRGLGLSRVGTSRILEDTPSVVAVVLKVKSILEVESV